LLREAFHHLLQDELPEVQVNLLANLDAIIENYANKHAVATFNSSEMTRIQLPERETHTAQT